MCTYNISYTDINSCPPAYALPAAVLLAAGWPFPLVAADAPAVVRRRRRRRRRRRTMMSRRRGRSKKLKQ